MNAKYFIVLAALMCSITIATAQPGAMGGAARERIESQRIAFITQRLNLTPEEATGFWPLYNEYRDALRDMRDDFDRPDLMSVTDEEASSLVEKHLQQEQRRLDLKRNLLTRLRSVIPARKIIMLHVAENAFNRELLRKAQEFRKP
jgi:hypothetical protein